MKKYFLLLALSGLLTAPLYTRADNLYDTFESGEDTSNWNSTWNNGSIVAGFLDSSIGGLNAGGGLSSGQDFSRTFANNTAGIDISQPYYVSMYLQINTNNDPSGGEFDIIDGGHGNSAVDIQVKVNGNGSLDWQAKDGSGNTYQNFGLSLSLGNPFRVLYYVDPTANTYSATVQSVDLFGNVLESATLDDLSGANNPDNGTLLYYLSGTGGGDVILRVDNITISSSPISTTPTPEPATLSLMMGGLAAVFVLRKRSVV